MQNSSRVRATSAIFQVKPGVCAVLDGRAIRILEVCSLLRVQVRVEGTGELMWARVDELSAPVASAPNHAVAHPLDANPAADAHAIAWSDVLAALPLRPTAKEVESLAMRMGVHTRTVKRRHARFLVDPTPASQLKFIPGPSPGSKRLAPAIEEIIDRSIAEIYLRRPRCPISAVYMRVRQRSAESGLKAPSYKAVSQRVRAIDPMLAVTKRFGPDRALAVQAPSVRGVTTHRALEMVQIDHALVDLIVVCPYTRLPIGRPWITLAIDVHTRCVVGYYLSMETPTQTCVALCLAHACLPKREWMQRLELEIDYPMFGRFESVSWDNAKTFRAAGIQAQCERYGIRVQLRPVKRPHYGAYIERYIGTFMGKVHLLPGTTFSNSRERGNYDSERHAIMTMKELSAWIGNEIVGVYHHTEHSGLSGITPYQKWLESWTREDGSISLPPMIASPRHFLVGLLPRDLRAVTREGISLFGLKYWDPAIAQLINDNRRYYVHYSHNDLSKVYLSYKQDYIEIPLVDRTRSPFSIYELREAKQALKARSAAGGDEEVLFAAMEKQRQIQDEAALHTKRARRKQARRATPVAAAPSRVSVDYSIPVNQTNFDEAEKL